MPFEPHFFARFLGRSGDEHEGEGSEAEIVKDPVDVDSGDSGFTFVGHPTAESGGSAGGVWDVAGR
jgi:hypothetical protein